MTVAGGDASRGGRDAARVDTVDREKVHTFGSLFSGVGGMDLGLERAGWSCSWQVEIDDYCRLVLDEHWPAVPKFGDIKELDPHDLGPVDLVAGGFPCPPISSAGKRLGKADPRWLWPEFARILRHLRPRFVLVENVADLVHFDEFGDVLGDLAALGFDAEWSVLSACTVGAPHARERLFVVAHASRDDEPGEGALHAPPGGLWTEPRGSGGLAGHIDAGWLPEPDVDRVADGVPSRMVRKPLSRLGNAVVPKIAELIGRAILEAA